MYSLRRSAGGVSQRGGAALWRCGTVALLGRAWPGLAGRPPAPATPLFLRHGDPDVFAIKSPVDFTTAFIVLISTAMYFMPIFIVSDPREPAGRLTTAALHFRGESLGRGSRAGAASRGRAGAETLDRGMRKNIVPH